MAEGTVLQTMSGAVLSISANLPATYDAAGYGATAVVFTTVGHAENFGEHGGEKNVSQFTAVSDGVIQKFPGAINYGALNMTLGCMPSDAGQDIVDAAFASRNRYSLKIAYPTRTGESSGEIHYLDVLVTKRVWQDGAVDDVRKLAATFEVCRAPVVVAAT
jgi:hypothetical protein